MKFILKNYKLFIRMKKKFGSSLRYLLISAATVSQIVKWYLLHHKILLVLCLLVFVYYFSC